MILRIMREQALNQEFNFYYSKLTEGQKRSLLTMMKSFLDKTEERSQRISVTQYNKELEEAEKRVAQGQFITQESLREEAGKW